MADTTARRILVGALVRRLVNMHGGAVTVESTLGEGSTFSVYLPVEFSAPEEKAKNK